MAIAWRRTAAMFLCAVCAAAAAPGLAGLTAIAPGPDVQSPGGRAVTPTIEPAMVSASVEPAVMQLRLLTLTREPEFPTRAVEDALAKAGRGDSSATHTVVAGDTLWTVAKSAGVNVRALAAANSLSETDVLRIGRVLTIPAAGAAAQASARSPQAALDTRAVLSRAAASPRPARPQHSTEPLVALLWPSRGIVTSRFGWRVHPIFGGREFHTGVDIGARYGSPVVAARTGVVQFVGWKTGYGRIIVVQHDGGLETAYSHLSAAVVSPGDHVAQGQVIGRIGSTGWSTGPHLLFEVRRNGVPVDPAPYLN